MVLTPIDIQNKEFTKSGRKGYDAKEVTDYLNQIIADYATLIEMNNQLKTQVADYEARDAQIEEMKQSVTQSILVAQEAADRLKKTADESAKKTLTQSQEEAQKLLGDAKEQSETLIRDAENKSQTILNDAAAENEKLVIETSIIKKDTVEFKAKLKSLLLAQLDLVDSNDWEKVLSDRGFEIAPKTKEYIQKNSTTEVDNDTENSVNSDTSTEPVKTYILLPDEEGKA
ncbi:DivIVA domain-containing protein [Periweissella beninensis]|uniref:DivIVA domain-containing protein n=1 Tax=Periweissella beninensis TaxID=504936 RepID=UPI0021A5EDE4|nr:DivIVA domain-containing protein [Periweissella beninensis]MCT4396617.1 DivIVA domain-containing protein [Periweissella beninensis]